MLQYNVSLLLIIFTFDASVFIQLSITIWRDWRCWRSIISGVVNLLYVFYQVFDFFQLRTLWLMSNYTFLQISKSWDLVVKFRNGEVLKMNILIYIIIYFCGSTLLLKRLHIYFLKIFELFWYVKIENGVFGQIQKTLDTKWACISKRNYEYILYKNIPVHSWKSKLCTGIFKF